PPLTALPSGTNGAVHASVGRRGTLTAPIAGLTISGALGALGSTSSGAEALRVPVGGGLSAVPLTVIVNWLPLVGRAVVTVRIVVPAGLTGLSANVAVAPGGRLPLLSVTVDVKFGPLTESTATRYCTLWPAQTSLFRSGVSVILKSGGPQFCVLTLMSST